MASKSWFISLLLISLFLPACAQEESQSHIANETVLAIDEPIEEGNFINPKGNTIETRFLLPEGFKRKSVSKTSFAHYLRNLRLKADGAEVSYYDERKKRNFGVYEAVVDMDIGKRDLHQCADAVMRLWAEHHYEQKEYDRIHFNFTNGFRVDYNEWRKGKRIVVKGNKSYWSQSASPSDSYRSFWKYMEIIFSYAGTLSLEKELIAVSVEEMKIGDVFIQGGSPGHAIIVVDMAENEATSEKVFLLAQSYMPAQEIQVLSNPNSETLGPWYSLDFGEQLRTPEWGFLRGDLKRFDH
ncbi:MAG: DUF4846 domain-containing protein [Bacteroidota bacterium]